MIDRDSWNSWEGVTVISYAGLSLRDKAMYPSLRRMEEQLTALKEAGYQTVRPEDVRAFLDGRAPLPRKALLILFEGGRKEALIRATPLLQRLGFSAVIAIPTALTQTYGSFFLNQSDVKRMGHMPHWQLGSMGHDAFAEIPVGRNGETGRFLTRRKWQDNAFEDAPAYQTRVLNDYARSAEWLRSASETPALLYLYPFADAGSFAAADPLAEAVNRSGVTQHFELAFVGGDDPFNGPDSDPWTLSRLRVSGDWNADQLLEHLVLSRPRWEGQPSLGQTQDWLFERGGKFENDTLVLSTHAAAWLRGTDDWSDLDVKASLTTGADGVASLYARYASPRSWVRVSLAPDGLRVQERLQDRIQTLLFKKWPSPVVPGEHRLRIRLRNNRAWVWHNDEILATQLPLAAVTSRGRIGFGVEAADMTVQLLQAELLPMRMALINSIRLIPDEQQPRLQAILPVWFRAKERPRIAETHRQDLMQAAITGIETIPVIAGTADLTPEAAMTLARNLDERIQEQGLRSLLLTLGLDSPSDDLAAALRERGYRVVFLLNAQQALRGGGPLAQMQTEDEIVITDSSGEGLSALNTLLHFLPANRISLSESRDSEFGPNIQTALRANDLSQKKESK